MYTILFQYTFGAKMSNIFSNVNATKIDLLHFLLLNRQNILVSLIISDIVESCCVNFLDSLRTGPYLYQTLLWILNRTRGTNRGFWPKYKQHWGQVLFSGRKQNPLRWCDKNGPFIIENYTIYWPFLSSMYMPPGALLIIGVLCMPWN